MKDFEETKRFNVEDITIDKDDVQDKSFEEKNEEAINLENSMEELDEIVNEDNESKDFEADDSEVLVKENTEEISTETEATDEIDSLLKETDKVEKLMDPALESIVKNDYQEKTIVEMEVPKDKTIGIASDHRGYKLKQKLTNYLTKKGYTVVDFGTDNTHSSDYPEFGFKLGEAVAAYEVEKGIAICGSGIGISIACNKIKGVRCAKVDNVKETKYARKDNDANVIAIAGNIPTFRAKDIVDAYLKTSFTGLERHKKRIEMLDNRG